MGGSKQDRQMQTKMGERKIKVQGVEREPKYLVVHLDLDVNIRQVRGGSLQLKKDKFHYAYD